MSSLTKIPAGVQYFFDDEVRLRRHVERQAMEVFAGWSYDEIIVPMFDYHDLFARGMGTERAEQNIQIAREAARRASCQGHHYRGTRAWFAGGSRGDRDHSHCDGGAQL